MVSQFEIKRQLYTIYAHKIIIGKGVVKVVIIE